MNDKVPADTFSRFQTPSARGEIPAIWSAHQLALAVGNLIERHHAQIRALIQHAQSDAPLGDEDAEAVRSYRRDLERIRGVLESLDSRLERLDSGGVAGHR